MAMKPVVALVGRPNVGKSTLFNRLTKSRDALVANYPGLTRDRKYGEATHDGYGFMLIDTGGISGDEQGIDSEMAKQSLIAIDEADVVILLVDARDGLTPADEMIARHLRESSKAFMLAANKVDGVNMDVVLADFYRLGTETVFPITATHGRGIKQLFDRVVEQMPVVEQIEDKSKHGVKIAIIGRPNVGKSTLVNRLLGEERVLVYDQPGTTRDSVYIDYQRDDVHYTLIDTAGVRRRKNVKETVEKFSIVKTLQAINDANVVILVMDAQEGVVDQDLHLLGLAMDAGRGLVIALNKWDGLEQDKKARIKVELDRRLRFIDYAELHTISALHGSGVGKLYGSVSKAYHSSTVKLQTQKLTKILEGAVFDHSPPLVQGRRIKLRYAHAGGSNPPIIVIHGNQTDKVPDHYRRYLEKTFRRELNLSGTPIKIEFRTSENPYAGRRNKLSDRQNNKRKRLKKFVKKKK